VKILHVDSALEWRGGQNQVLLSAGGMASRGHAATLACRAGGALEERARASGIPLRPLAFGRGDFSLAGTLALARVYRELRPDVVHLHDPHGIGAGLLAARLTGSAAHLVGTRRVDFPLRGPLSRWKYGACDRLIAVSQAIMRVLDADGVPRARLRLVYEGVPDRPPEDGGRKALAALGVPEGAPVVGKVAALADHKDHMTFLAAAARVSERLPEARFLIVGDGELRSRVEARVRELGLEGRCLVTGFRTDLDRLIPAFTVFCLSSRTEGLGTSLLDAMCFSRPIVATAAGGIPEAVEDGLTGRVVPVQSPEALAAALLEVLCDPARQRAMGEAGRRRFEERFTADRMVEETLEVYRELGLQGKRGNA
jgi:glycosyltransferase involved in cell wall biosynthesis